MKRSVWSLPAWVLICSAAFSCKTVDPMSGSKAQSDDEPAAASTTEMTDGLPVFNLQVDGQLNSDNALPGKATYKGHVYDVKVKVRGAMSSHYPKQSYSVNFNKKDLFSDPTQAGGFNNKHKIALYSSFDDNSYVRTRFAYEMWNRMDPQHVQIKTYNSVVYLNGEYLGFYLVTDRVDDDFLAAVGLNPEANLYKAIGINCNFRFTEQKGGAPKSSLHVDYEKPAGQPADGEDGAYDDLDELITFVATSSDQDFSTGIGQRINVKEFEDWYIFVTLIENGDSAGKNAFLYHDVQAGTPWRFIPWDMNQSFGQSFNTAREKSSEPIGGFYLRANQLFTRLVADPVYGPEIKARYAAALNSVWSLEALSPVLDQMIKEVTPAAHHDEAKWTNVYRTYRNWKWRTDFTTFDQEVTYLRQWMNERWAIVPTMLQ